MGGNDRPVSTGASQDWLAQSCTAKTGSEAEKLQVYDQCMDSKHLRHHIHQHSSQVSTAHESQASPQLFVISGRLISTHAGDTATYSGAGATSMTMLTHRKAVADQAVIPLDRSLLAKFFSRAAIRTKLSIDIPLTEVNERRMEPHDRQKLLHIPQNQ